MTTKSTAWIYVDLFYVYLLYLMKIVVCYKICNNAITSEHDNIILHIRLHVFIHLKF